MTTSPAVRVKSHIFDLFLTQKRLILTQPDFPDATPAEIVFASVSSFSPGETEEGAPSLSLQVVAGERERTMVLVFDGAGVSLGTDERDRVAELVRGMVAETETIPQSAPVPSAVPVAEGDGPGPVAPETVTPSSAAPPPPAAPPSGGAGEDRAPAPAPHVETPPAPEKPPEKPVVSGLKADHIIVKGHEFTATLTPETLSLVRHEDPKSRPLTVKRADVTGVVSKVSAGGDPSMHIRVRAAGGSERTMVLVFSEWYSGGRAPERDAWAAALMETATVAERPPAAQPARPAPRRSEAPPPTPSGRPPVAPPISGTQRFCTECGAPLSGSPRFCPNCGTSLGGGAPGAGAGGIRDLPFDAAAEEAHPEKRRKPKPKREKPEKRKREPRERRSPSFRFRSQEQGLSEVPFVEKFIGFLAAPQDAFRYTKNDSFGQALVYLAIVLAVFGTVSALVLHFFAASLDAAEYPQMAALGADIVTAALLIPRIVILGVVAVLLWSLVMHILLRVFGESDSPGETFRTCAYAATPFGTVGLIPFIGPPLAALWTLLLAYKGLVVADDVEGRFALIAVVVPLVLVIAIFYLFFSAGGTQ